jgi:hypothetical protein
MEENSSDQRFRWPKTKNPILIIVRLLGRSTVFLMLGVMYLIERWKIESKFPFLIFFNFFLLSLAWLFLQQKLKVYKLLGWVVVFVAVWITLIEFFPDIFAITPWW